MLAVVCPTCKNSMQIDEQEPDTEWECPSCETVFRVKGRQAEGVAVEIVDGSPHSSSSPPAVETGISAEPPPVVAPPPVEAGINPDDYVYALECLVKGHQQRDVRKSLLEAGYSQKQVDHILQTAVQYRREHERLAAVNTESASAGQRNMMIGGIVCVVGIVITMGSLMAASGGGGGSYVIAWGAIVFGAIQFFRGLTQSQSGSGH
jgi:hypothetical protein